MEKKQTAQEALAIALKTQKFLSVPGSNWTKLANHIIARNVLDSELGRFADELPVYHLDQETRDRLLVHARQDAAEAMCHVSSLMDDVHQLRATLRSWNFTACVLVVGFLLSLWWKAGFTLPFPTH
jgi:hypothetical protein